MIGRHVRDDVVDQRYVDTRQRVLSAAHSGTISRVAIIGFTDYLDRGYVPRAVELSRWTRTRRQTPILHPDMEGIVVVAAW